MTFFPGTSGTTQQDTYTVQPLSTDTFRTVSSGSPPTPVNFQLSVVDNKFTLTWLETENSPIEKVVFTQGALRKEYLLTNFHSKFEVPNQDFAFFRATSTLV